MSAYPPPEPGFCVCGRALPDDPLSDWACSEPCQSAWYHHHADPQYPHPRQIRDAAEHAAQLRRAVAASAVSSGQQPMTEVAEGTEINVDGQPFVRVGSHWQPAGMWVPLMDNLADRVRYQRWCPTCRQRTPSLIYPADDRQECAGCGHQWPGRPLLGQVEFRGQPWPGVRLRLFDGQRSIVAGFSQDAVNSLGTDDIVRRMLGCWLRLERQLCGGFADIDQPDERQQRRQQRRLRHDWHMSTSP